MDYFLQNSKSIIFGQYPQNKIFSWNSDFVSFLPLKHEVSEKSYKLFWRKHVYLLTYWHTDNGEIIGPLFT